jgi:Na+-driven multidrug efflux pump
MIFSGILASAGDTKFPAIVSFIGLIIGMLGPGITIAVFFRSFMNAWSITLLLGSYTWVCVIPLGTAFIRGKWKKVRLIKEGEEEEEFGF